jgi:TPR repeat protein
LGFLYEKGQGVPQDYAKAAAWYEKAAEQGYAGAQCNLSSLYENGRGVLQDYTKAAEWFEKAGWK